MTNDSSASIVSKVWNCAHVLKNAEVGHCDYVEVYRIAEARTTVAPSRSIVGVFWIN